MTRRGQWVVVGVIVMASAAAVSVYMKRDRETQRAVAPAAPAPAPPREVRPLTPGEHTRRRMFDELQPVKLSNCQLERFGEVYDGGYVMCGNLLKGATAAYSYGISGYDKWGCDISKRLSVRVHQYDCFDLKRPVCKGGVTKFHAECVGGKRERNEGRLYDTIANQIRRNGDAGKRIVMKMDVEGSEWASFTAAPDELLQRIDQLSIEMHGVSDERYLKVVARLKDYFYVVNLHYNNHACNPSQAPFPAHVYEVLFVNKRLAVLDQQGKAELPHPLDSRNNPTVADCQIPNAGR